MAGSAEDEGLQIARRHVLRGADLVARQEALVLRLDGMGRVELAKQADCILATLKTSLRLAREDLLYHETALGRRTGRSVRWAARLPQTGADEPIPPIDDGGCGAVPGGRFQTARRLFSTR